jgi:hypothetical protein
MRHARRHIEASAKAHLVTQLTALGWMGPTRPFNAPNSPNIAIGFIGLDGSTLVAAGGPIPLVSVSIPGDNEDEETEVGGAAVQTAYDLFVSVIAVPAIVGVLTEDIVDILAGRIVRPTIPFINQATQLTVAGETLEVEDVHSDRARLDRPDWMLITATVVRDFSRSWA